MWRGWIQKDWQSHTTEKMAQKLDVEFTRDERSRLNRTCPIYKKKKKKNSGVPRFFAPIRASSTTFGYQSHDVMI